MGRFLNSLALAIFTLGVVLAPAMHHAHLHDGGSACPCANGCPADHKAPEKHDAEHCPVCQLALTPLITGAPVVVLAPVGAAAAIPALSIPAPAVSAACVLPYSCGPPA